MTFTVCPLLSVNASGFPFVEIRPGIRREPSLWAPVPVGAAVAPGAPRRNERHPHDAYDCVRATSSSHYPPRLALDEACPPRFRAADEAHVMAAIPRAGLRIQDQVDADSGGPRRGVRRPGEQVAHGRPPRRRCASRRPGHYRAGRSSRCMSWRWSRCWPNATRTTRPIRRLARPSRASKRSACTAAPARPARHCTTHLNPIHPSPTCVPLCPFNTFLVSDLDRPFCHP